MDIKQFAKLKVGDLIRNEVSHSTGEVVDVDASGVRLRWLGAGSEKNNAPTWHYSVQSRAWVHWSTEKDANDEATLSTQPDNPTPTDAPPT